jgi:hypothetical protein
MLRDGHSLPEPPVKIGAHYVKFQRRELNAQEMMVQDVLLGYKPPRRVSKIELVALFVGCYAALSVLFGIFKSFLG